MSRNIILHVDDDANDVLLFEHAHQRAGLRMRVETLTDGQEAIAYLRGDGAYAKREQYPLPRLLLLDLKMPRVNGFDVLTWVRQHAPVRHLPVLVLTSSNHGADVRRAYELGANSYIVKPAGFDSLVDLAKAIHQFWFTWNELPDR